MITFKDLKKTMVFTEEDREKMDKVAQEAEKELTDLIIKDNTISGLANWWKKWYVKAGHKRLARILLQNARKEGK